jgi:hypothetical protein
MRSILADDLAQLRQIETKLAELVARPLAEQIRKQCLIDALNQSRSELARGCRRSPRLARLAA